MLEFDSSRSRIKYCPCGKSNKDRKFAAFKGYDEKGFCHSCGKLFLPEKNVSSFQILSGGKQGNSFSGTAKAAFRFQVGRESKQETPYSSVKKEILTESLKNYGSNNLVTFLNMKLGPLFTNKIISKYFIGTSENGGTIFWHIEQTGIIRSGKVMMYNSQTGKRIKESNPYWIHSQLFPTHFKFKGILFGEHLLKKNNSSVAIVESEKTACIASVYFPNFIWLACGGLSSLSFHKLSALKGRSIILFPDIGAYEAWSKKVVENENRSTIFISDFLERKANEDERKKKLDLADYLLRFPINDFLKLEMPYYEELGDGTKMLMHPSGYPMEWTIHKNA